MLQDIYSNSIFQTEDIFNLLYSRKIENLDKIIAEPSSEVNELLQNSNLKFITSNEIDYTKSVVEFDRDNQNNWLIPAEYKNFDIKKFCLSKCIDPKEIDRVKEEFEEFKKRDMLPLLQVLKYIVDTLNSNQIVMGVGRGSSVSSYILYLLGVHKINSLRYNLDWREFLR